tara:strand:+ start:331 stop:1062 length:732 start_codon:yes stop_codon:yes gene_type:complete
MRYYKVNKIEHTVFESENEVPREIEYLEDWRDGHQSDWVLSDDGCIIQILRAGTMLKPKGKIRSVRYLGTCTGTFLVSDKVKMDTSRRINIYSLGGNIERDQRLEDRANLSSREEIFVQYLASGMDARMAYLRAFPTNDPHYAGLRAGQLVKTTRVKTAMKEELKPICEELDIDERMVLKGIKDEAKTAEKADTRLKALFKLSDILDLEDKNKTSITQISGAVFQGFDRKEIENVKRPKEISE